MKNHSNRSHGPLLLAGLLVLSFSAEAQILFVADEESGNIYEFTPCGAQSTFASGLNYTNALAFDRAGNLFVSAYGNYPTGGAGGTGAIYEFQNTSGTGTLSSTPTHFATGLVYPEGLAFDSAGDLFESDSGSGAIYKFQNTSGTLSSTPTLFDSELVYPEGLAFDSAGDLFVADAGSGAIYEFQNTSGTLSSTPTLFASGLEFPEGLAFDSAGDLFVSDSESGAIYEFQNTSGTLSSTPTLFASGLLVPAFLAFQPMALQSVSVSCLS